MKIATHVSPLGALSIISDGEALTALEFENPKYPVRFDAHAGTDRVIDETRRQLDAYFAGTRRTFDLPTAPRGTPFQQKVWTALARIPFGATRTYRAIAEEIGLPKAMRAVGAANGRNPVAIVIPCHRVIGADGTLTGYAGGLERKHFLLELESGQTAIRCA